MSDLESQMSFVNQEWEFCDTCDELGGDFHLLSVVLGKRNIVIVIVIAQLIAYLDLSLCKQSRSDFK